MPTNFEKILAITPEGTRSPNKKWKSGFYRIALKADIPIYLTFSDFKTKTAGFIGEFKPTGDFDKDIYFHKRTLQRDGRVL